MMSKWITPILPIVFSLTLASDHVKDDQDSFPSSFSSHSFLYALSYGRRTHVFPSITPHSLNPSYPSSIRANKHSRDIRIALANIPPPPPNNNPEIDPFSMKKIGFHDSMTIGWYILLHQNLIGEQSPGRITLSGCGVNGDMTQLIHHLRREDEIVY